MPKQTILVIDDDPEMRLALQIRLRANGYEVFTAVDGVSAVAEARRVMPDLVLLDLGLPAGDGFAVLERLKANDTLSSIPVLVLSGRDRLVNSQKALSAGAAKFLQKPIKHSELLTAVTQTLHASPANDPVVVYDLGHRSTEPLRSR